MDLNKVMLIGRLTQEPEVKQTPSGQTVATFSVATGRKWKNQSGELQEKTEFNNCVAWRRLAEIVQQYTHKGSKVYIEGHLETRSWEAQDGTKRYRTEIVLDNMILLDAKGAGGGSSGGGGGDFSGSLPPGIKRGKDAFGAGAGAAAGGELKPVSPDAFGEDDLKIEDIPF